MDKNNTGESSLPDFKSLFGNVMKGVGNVGSNEPGSSVNLFPTSLMDTVYSSGEKGIRALPSIIESGLAHKLISKNKTCYQFGIPSKILNSTVKELVDNIEAVGLKLVLESKDSADFSDFIMSMSNGLER